MKWLRWTRTKDRERDLDEEIGAHLRMAVQDRTESGESSREARESARREFGNIGLVKEVTREMWGWSSVERLKQDLRYATRQLVKNPGFACTAIFTLALGVCATAAIFGFVDATLIKPLPYHDQSRLVGVFETTATAPRGTVSYLDYVDWKNLNTVFSSIDAYDVRTGFILSTTEGAEHVTGMKVTDGFFRTLGVTPVLGRAFHLGEASPAAPHVVLLSYGAWQQRFGGRQDVLGRTVTLDGVPSLIIGVLPRSFYFAPAGRAEFWEPVHASTDACQQRRPCRSMLVIARLKDGISIQTALADMKSVAQQLRREYPNSNLGANVLLLSDVIVGDVRPILLTLLSGAGLLLLIACINVVSLLLARSDSRRRETAVRNALGASFARLFRQFATEGLVLSGTGGVFGLLFAEWGIRFLTRLIPPEMMDSMPYLQGLGLNLRVVAFACVISLIAGILFAIAPISRLSLLETMEGLKEGSRGSAGITWRRFGSNLVVLELAIAVVLLACAGLLGKSLYRLLQVDTGLQADHLATLQIDPPPARSDDEQVVALERQILEKIANLPGVKSVGISDQLPLAPGEGTTTEFRVVGRPYHGEHNEASNRRVSSGYFKMLQARLLDGHYFSEAEAASKRPIVIINETMAKQYFPDEDPIGKPIFYSTPPYIQIVGVVADIKEGPLDEPPRPALYVPFDQSPNVPFAVVARTSQAAQSLLPSLAATIHQIESGISIHGEATMTERINESPSAYLHRSSAWLVGSFAAIAFLLGVVGLYGVIAYSVGQRTREIGVRMALGAQPRSVYQLILTEAAWLALAGTTAGILCSVAVATLIRRLLFGVHSWDVPTLAAVAAVLVISALLASYIPARRAARVDPMAALRNE